MPTKQQIQKQIELEAIKEAEIKEYSEIKEEKESIKKFKKILIAIASVLVLILILTYLVPSYNIFWIIPARFNSFTAENNIIELKNNKIIFESNSFEKLQEIYFNNQQHEFKACLIGEKEDNYIVKEIFEPEIISQSFNSVSSKPCPRNTIIDLHSHPYQSCYFSLHDITTYRFVKKRNKDAILGIMCEAKRFNFHGFN